MPEFTRTKMTVRRRLPDGGTIGLLGFVEAHERGKMTDEQRDEIVELLNRGTHYEKLMLQLQRNQQGLRNLLELDWITHEGHRQAILETIIEIDRTLKAAGGI